jgi:hypothetical protein
MHTAAIHYRNGKLEAAERDDLWTVRLANLEVRARYLDLALAELLGNAPEAHRAAARLLVELTEVVDRQDAAYYNAATGPRPERQRSPRYELRAPLLLLGVRVFALAAIVATAFMVTTWLSALR